MKRRMLLACAALHTVIACSGTQLSEKAQVERPGGEGTVVLTIEGIKSSKGKVYGSVYISAEGFPDDKTLAYTYAYSAAAAARDGVIELTFAPVPAGWFVIAVLHDKDGDEELSFNSLGIPKEKYGFSLNPDSLFGPPSFDESAVYLAPGETKALTVNIQ